MPSKNKVTYGTTVKQRAKRLLEALLAYVNWELEDVDGISLSYRWQDETTEQPKLVIKTQLRTLEFLTGKDKHEGQLTKTQIRQALKEHLEDFLEILEDTRAKTQGKEEWDFTLKLWSKDKEKNLEQFEIEWERKRPEKSKRQEEIIRETVLVDMPPIEDNSPDWRGICGQMLAEQRQLTTNAFTNADGVSLQREEIYVPLAIVERKPPKPQPRNPQEEKEEEKLIPIAEESFFEEVLRSGQSSSQGRRIAVIGEPGSGKTTRLQKIADWILEQGLGLPIWISLADLTQPTIAQYIEEFWLKQTGQSLTIEELTQQKDQIWLLLDGVDEMTSRVETRHVSALLGGWLQAVRVVVSCRVNVWEADKNAFSGFDVFRNLEFSPEQVRDYIRCWFAGAGDVATGEDLDRALSQSENYRLKELIQNPLRLWMLCHIQYKNRGKNRGGLPETQAELYGQFVDRVYDWKADEEILDQREAIDAALAKLALAAMEQQDEVSRFRLRESWVVKKLGSRQIFEAVKRLGWLNRVERSPEAICVFYHATFQEYFAALGVEDWDYFLPRDHESSPVDGREYRIFEPQWKQVILLWLGREDIADEEKKEFINKLVSFDMGCESGNFYSYRAFFLAAEGITQYANFEPIGKNANIQEYSLVDAIIIQLVEWALGNFDADRQKWITYLDPIKEGAEAALRVTKQTKVIDYLSQSLEMMLYSDEVMAELEDEDISEENQVFIEQLTTYIRCLNDFPERGSILSGKEHLIINFTRILSEIDSNNEIAIISLIRILETTEDEYTRGLAADRLSRIAKGNPQVIAALIRILETTEDDSTRRQAAESLGEIDQGNPQVIPVLIKILETTENEYTRRQAAGSLGRIAQGNSHAIAALIRILETTEDDSTRRKAAESLGEIDQGNPQAIAIVPLVKIVDTTKDDSVSGLTTESLDRIAQGNSQVIAELIRILETSEDESIRRQAAESLGEIDQGNPQPQAITELIRILETTENNSTRRQAAKSLDRIAQGNSQAIAELIRILETTKDFSLETFNKDKDTYVKALDSLGKIAKGNPQAITALIRILKTSKNFVLIWGAVLRLGEILTTPEQYVGVVSALKDCFSNEVHQDNSFRSDECYTVLWECAANLPYPDFYHAWHSTSE